MQESHQLQLFKANQRLLLDWTLKQSDEMVKKGLPKNKTEAESFILEHQNWKVLKYIYSYIIKLFNFSVHVTMIIFPCQLFSVRLLLFCMFLSSSVTKYNAKINTFTVTYNL